MASQTQPYFLGRDRRSQHSLDTMQEESCTSGNNADTRLADGQSPDMFGGQSAGFIPQGGLTGLGMSSCLCHQLRPAVSDTFKSELSAKVSRYIIDQVIHQSASSCGEPLWECAYLRKNPTLHTFPPQQSINSPGRARLCPVRISWLVQCPSLSPTEVV